MTSRAEEDPKILLVRTWLKLWRPRSEQDRWMQSVCFRVAIPSHPCFAAPCLEHPFYSFRSTLKTLTPGSPSSPSLLFPTMSPPLPLCKEGYALAGWLNIPHSQVMSPNLSWKSAANTLRSSYLREVTASTRMLTTSRPSATRHA